MKGYRIVYELYTIKLLMLLRMKCVFSQVATGLFHKGVTGYQVLDRLRVVNLTANINAKVCKRCLVFLHANNTGFI